MKIDSSYKKNFKEMGRYMEVLSKCDMHGRGSADLPSKPGIYLFWYRGKPIYVGRTKNLKDRIQNHSRNSSTHSSASFAYILTKKKCKKLKIECKGTRQENCENKKFAKMFAEERRRVAEMQIQFVVIENHAHQALFEVCASLAFHTQHNSWETH